MTEKRRKIGREIIKVTNVNHHLPSLIVYQKHWVIKRIFIYIFISWFQVHEIEHLVCDTSSLIPSLANCFK